MTTKLWFFLAKQTASSWGFDIWILLAYFHGRKSNNAASQTSARVTGFQTLSLKWPSPLTEVIYLFMDLGTKHNKSLREMNVLQSQWIFYAVGIFIKEKDLIMIMMMISLMATKWFNSDVDERTADASWMRLFFGNYLQYVSKFSSPQTLFQQLRRAQTRKPEDQQAQHWRLPLYPQPRFPSLQSGYKQKLIVYSTQQIRYAIAICISHIKET